MSDPVSIQDSPTERTIFTELRLTDQERFLEDIRERRLAARKIYESIQDAKRQAKNEKLAGKAEKLEARIRKKLEAADKAISDVEALYRDVRAIVLEVGAQDD